MLSEWAQGFAQRRTDRKPANRRRLRVVWGMRRPTRYDRILAGVLERFDGYALTCAFALGLLGGAVAYIKYTHDHTLFNGFMVFGVVGGILALAVNSTINTDGATSTIFTVFVIAAVGCPTAFVFGTGVGFAAVGTTVFLVFAATLIDCGGTRLRLIAPSTPPRQTRDDL